MQHGVYFHRNAVEIQPLVELTGQDGSPLALFLHVAVLLPRESKGRLKDEAVDVVIPLEIRLLFLLLLLVEVRHHVCNLNVGEFRIQVFGVHLDTPFRRGKDFMKKSPQIQKYTRVIGE